MTEGSSTDAGPTDTGSTDAGSTDTGSTDAGSTDTGSTDAGSTATSEAPSDAPPAASAGRGSRIVSALAALVLVGVLVTLGVQVGAEAVWSPPDPTELIAAPGGVRPCGGPDLALGTAVAGGGRLDLVWRQQGTSPCELDGFPVVDLVGPDTPRFGRSLYGSIVNVPRDEDAEPRAFTLAPGATARSTVVWTPPGGRPGVPGGQAWTPDRLVVGAGGINQSVPWPAGAVLVGPEDDRGVAFGPFVAG